MHDNKLYNNKYSLLFITNYKSNVGGISGQVKILNDYLSIEGVKTKIFSSGRSKIRPFLIFTLIFTAKNYDIIHIHGCSYLGGFYPIVLGTLVGKILKKRIIITYHGGAAREFFGNHPSFIKIIMKYAQHITVPSRYLANIFFEYGFQPIVIPNIINKKFVKFRIREEINPYLIVTRSLEKIYNIECAIKAFQIVKERHENGKLIIIGDGSERKNLELFVNQLNLEDVVFKGRIPNNDIYNELNKSDIFLNPTTIDNMPVSSLEALACGLLIISTKVGGIPYIIKDNENGLLVDDNDHVAMADKVDELIRNKKLSRKLINNGKKCIDNYNWHAIREKLYATYEMKFSYI